MTELTGKDTSWSSPGGGYKMFSLDDVQVRWYVNTKSLTINGIKNEEIKSKLRDLSNSVDAESTTNTAENIPLQSGVCNCTCN